MPLEPLSGPSPYPSTSPAVPSSQHSPASPLAHSHMSSGTIIAPLTRVWHCVCKLVLSGRRQQSPWNLSVPLLASSISRRLREGEDGSSRELGQSLELWGLWDALEDLGERVGGIWGTPKRDCGGGGTSRPLAPLGARAPIRHRQTMWDRVDTRDEVTSPTTRGLQRGRLESIGGKRS